MKQLVNISQVKINPQNPRLIKDEKFKKLVKSLQDFPEMLETRPIVVNTDNIILGGNMRFKAAIEAGFRQVWIETVNWPEEKQKEFIIKDNISGGEWDWDVLANEWNAEQLEDWGLSVFQQSDVDMDQFFREHDEQGKEKKDAIILQYPPEEYQKVVNAFDKIGGSREQIVWELLQLK